MITNHTPELSHIKDGLIFDIDAKMQTCFDGTNAADSLKDLSGYGNSTTPQNLTVTTDKNVFTLNGVSTMAERNNQSTYSYNINNTGKICVEMWVKFDSLSSQYDAVISNGQMYGSNSNQQWLVTKHSAYFGMIVRCSNESYLLFLYHTGVNIPIPSQLNTSEYHHIVFQSDIINNIGEVYLNSSLIRSGFYVDDNTNTIANTPPTAYNKLSLWGDGSLYSEGEYGALRLYDRLLTLNEVSYNYKIQKERYDIESIITNGLILHLDAGNSSSYPGSGTTWTDLTSNGNNGTLVNGVAYDSNNGGSLDFDGTNDYITLSSSLIPSTNNWTWSCWFNLDTIVGAGVLYGQYIQLAGNGRFLIEFEGVAGANLHKLNIRLLSGSGYGSYILYSTLVPTTGQWYNLAISRNGNTYTIYIDGVSNVSDTTSFTASLLQTTPIIGGRGTSTSSPTPATTGFIDGKISIVFAYSRALTSQEILHNYNATKSRYE